jgi:DNA-binding NtrC family response regulator
MNSILIVEDDDAYRRSLEQILTKSGFSTVLATNGREAIAAYDPEKIAAVVLDLIMPDIEGIETLTKLRRSFPKVKVLAISGGGQIGAKDYLDLAAKLGANATLAKPFTPEALMTELQRVLGTN